MISCVAIRAVWGLRPVEVMNMSKLKNIHPGEVLQEEFMAPMGFRCPVPSHNASGQ